MYAVNASDLHLCVGMSPLVRKDGELTEVDCRPSDAIAVAVASRVPIYVEEGVLGEALEDE